MAVIKHFFGSLRIPLKLHFNDDSYPWQSNYNEFVSPTNEHEDLRRFPDMLRSRETFQFKLKNMANAACFHGQHFSCLEGI